MLENEKNSQESFEHLTILEISSMCALRVFSMACSCLTAAAAAVQTMAAATDVVPTVRQVRRLLWARRHLCGRDGRDSPPHCASSPRPTVRHPFAPLFAPPHPAAPPRPRITLLLTRHCPTGAPALAGPLPPHRLFSSLRHFLVMAARYPPTPLPSGPRTHHGRWQRNRRRRLPPPPPPPLFGGGGWTWPPPTRTWCRTSPPCALATLGTKMSWGGGRLGKRAGGGGVPLLVRPADAALNVHTNALEGGFGRRRVPQPPAGGAAPPMATRAPTASPLTAPKSEPE